jgi:NAD(P)-dependent dehydrogenase (short-subunit alcohol dehydrogenase family)
MAMAKGPWKQAFPNLLKEVAISRMGIPAEFSHFVKSIVENSYINGVHLRIDGGARLSNL